MYDVVANGLLHHNSWKAEARVLYFNCAAYVLSTHITFRTKGENEHLLNA